MTKSIENCNVSPGRMTDNCLEEHRVALEEEVNKTHASCTSFLSRRVEDLMKEISKRRLEN